jgi:dolichyl-phosphate beta-glucosyltransferase
LRQVRDTQCGFKLFQRELIVETLPKLQFFQGEAPQGWKVTAYDVELLYLFDRAGHGILEVEVEWENRDVSDTKGHRSEMQRYLRESVSMAREVLRVNINRIKGMYD